MNKLLLFFTAFIFAGMIFNPVYAQTQKGEFINASIGMGLCAPYDEADISGTGFYAQAEYVWNPYTWLGVRPYAGVVIASDEINEPGMQQMSIKSNAALLGAKARLTAPIPYVAPFIESGVGVSFGSFETYTPYTNIKKSGALLHIPVSLGLAIGRKHNYELKFTYYYHNSAEQFSGAAALGFSFPIGNDKE
jgi:hypothetical protein